MLVSVVIPTYNRAAYAVDSIASVLQQTHSELEVIVVDDGSTDNTISLMEGLHDNRVQVLPCAHSGLIGKLRNAGIQRAKGDFVAFHDSDDLWALNKLDAQLSLLTENPEAQFCISNGLQFGDGAIESPDSQSLMCEKLFRPFLLEHQFPFYVPSLILRRSALEAVGPFNEHYESLADIEFFCRLSYQHAGIFTDQRLVSIRKHADNHSTLKYDVTHRELLDVYQSLLTKKMISRREHGTMTSHAYYNFALDQMRRNNARAAVETLIKSLRVNPFHLKSWMRIGQASLKTLVP